MVAPVPRTSVLSIQVHSSAGLAARPPVISIDMGSVADVISHGVTRLLAPARDEVTPADHLARLGRAPVLQVAMGDQVRAGAVAGFSGAAMAERYGELLNNTLLD